MSVRFFIILVLVMVAMLALFLALLATETALSVWQRLSAAPLWLQAAYLLIVFLVASASVLLAWRWLKPRQTRTKRATRSGPLDDASLQNELLESASSGVDVESALAEIREQRRRKAHSEVYIALFGEVSTGKSSLVNALLPDARTESDPRAGTTLTVRHYRWTARDGDSVIISDLPGFNLGDHPEAMDEARRSHLVIFLCDGDLADSQFQQLRQLQESGKPLLIALNKMDRYSDSERQSIVDRIAGNSGLPLRDIVQVKTGGREEVVRMLSDGTERADTREREADIRSLRTAIQRHLDENLELMESLRDTAVLLLASEKLERAKHEHRETEAEQLVHRYSRRAVVGAMAAVAPGSDIVIQGVLATRLVQELCKLYDVEVKEVQIESFLKLAGGKIKNASAITLAIAGNALKAFPGMGTLSGGLMHAVAYGLIFDSLGRAAAQTLASRGELRPYPAVQAFEELLRENLESGAGRFAKLAISQKAKADAS
ncbi:MAG: 50S ribosome-binding GTPase [Gammaproteobacteria bacterium]|nr:50S ribosome-binding GTPase [Gammaproteobacteria bacterium]